MLDFAHRHSGKIFALFMTILLSALGYVLYNAPVVGLENKFIYLMKEYGYIILFFWGMLDQELLTPVQLFGAFIVLVGVYLSARK